MAPKPTPPFTLSLQMWDIDLSTVKPVVTHKQLGVALTCLCFAANGPVVVAGSADGKVAVFRCGVPGSVVLGGARRWLSGACCFAQCCWNLQKVVV